MAEIVILSLVLDLHHLSAVSGVSGGMCISKWRPQLEDSAEKSSPSHNISDEINSEAVSYESSE